MSRPTRSAVAPARGRLRGRLHPALRPLPSRPRRSWGIVARRLRPARCSLSWNADRVALPASVRPPLDKPDPLPTPALSPMPGRVTKRFRNAAGTGVRDISTTWANNGNVIRNHGVCSRRAHTNRHHHNGMQRTHGIRFGARSYQGRTAVFISPEGHRPDEHHIMIAQYTSAPWRGRCGYDALRGADVTPTSYRALVLFLRSPGGAVGGVGGVPSVHCGTGPSPCENRTIVLFQ